MWYLAQNLKLFLSLFSLIFSKMAQSLSFLRVCSELQVVFFLMYVLLSVILIL